MRALFPNSVAKKSDGTVLANRVFTLELLSAAAVRPDEAYVQTIWKLKTDSNGRFPAGLSLPTPETGAWRWRLRWPDGQMVDAPVAQGDGAALEVDDFIALAELDEADAAAPQNELLLAMYNGAQEVAGVKVWTAQPGGAVAWEDPPGGSGMVEPTGDGLWARLRASGVVSWLMATTIGRALFTAVSETAARQAIGAAAATDLLNHMADTAQGVHGSTTVGRNLLTLPTWGLPRFLRVNATGSVSLLSGTELAVDIGALQRGNNLSDVIHQSTARGNIGAAGLGANTFGGLQAHYGQITFIGDYAASNRSALRTELGAVDTADSRLSDSRPPTPHAASHATGASDAITPSAIGAASIGDNTFTGHQNLGGNQLYGYRVREVVASVSGTYTISLLAGSLYVLTVTGDVTLSFADAPTSPGAASVTVILIQANGGGHAVAFAGTKWAGGAAPDLALPAGQETDVSFIVRHGGADIRGYVAAQDMR
jgi:hypothetical protein